MADYGEQIRQAFAQRGELTEADFQWLFDFLKEQQDENPGSVELLTFTVGHHCPYVFILLSVQAGYLGIVVDIFASHFPVPFRIEVLNRATPNPGDTIVTISWGGGL